MTAANPAAPQWIVERLRFTVFPGDLGAPQLGGNWERATGKAPDSTTSKPKEQLYQEKGAFGAGVLLCRQEPARLDWHYVPTSEREHEQEFPNLGPMPGALGVFSELVKKWTADLPARSRVALGGVLQLPQQDHSSAKQTLCALLPTINCDSESFDDLRFRINRFTQMDLNGTALQINRLAEWQLIVWSALTVKLTANAGSTSTELSNPSVQLDLDINTDGHRTEPLPAEHLPVVIDFLSEQFVHIATHGDEA